MSKQSLKKAWAFFMASAIILKKGNSAYFNLDGFQTSSFQFPASAKLAMAVCTAACTAFVSAANSYRGITKINIENCITAALWEQLHKSFLKDDHHRAKLLGLDEKQTANFILNNIYEREGGDTFAAAHGGQSNFNYRRLDNLTQQRRKYIDGIVEGGLAELLNDEDFEFVEPSFRYLESRTEINLDDIDAIVLNKQNQSFVAPDLLCPPQVLQQTGVFQTELVRNYLTARAIYNVKRDIRKQLNKEHKLNLLSRQPVEQLSPLLQRSFAEKLEYENIIAREIRRYSVYCKDTADIEFLHQNLQWALEQEVFAENEARETQFYLFNTQKQYYQHLKNQRRMRDENERRYLDAMHALAASAQRTLEKYFINHAVMPKDVDALTADEWHYLEREVNHLSSYYDDADKDELRALLLENINNKILYEQHIISSAESFKPELQKNTKSKLLQSSRAKDTAMSSHFSAKHENAWRRLGKVVATTSLVIFTGFSGYKGFMTFLPLGLPLAIIIGGISMLATYYTSRHFASGKIINGLASIGKKFDTHFYELRTQMTPRLAVRMTLLSSLVIGMVSASTPLLFYSTQDYFITFFQWLLPILGASVAFATPIGLAIAAILVAITTIGSIRMLYTHFRNGIPDKFRQSFKNTINNIKASFHTHKGKFACQVLGAVLGVAFVLVTTIIEVGGSQLGFVKNGFTAPAFLVGMAIGGALGNLLFNFPDTMRGMIGKMSSLFDKGKVKLGKKPAPILELDNETLEVTSGYTDIMKNILWTDDEWNDRFELDKVRVDTSSDDYQEFVRATHIGPIIEELEPDIVLNDFSSVTAPSFGASI